MDRFIEKPNLPEGAVSYVLVDGRTRQSVIAGLKGQGTTVILSQKCIGLYEAVSFHPDMFMHHVGGSNIVAAPNAPLKTIKELASIGFNIINGQRIITGKYPDSIAYNVARIENYAICNIEYSDPVLLSYLRDSGTKLINVKQGYSKCSVCVAGNGIIITSDDGIYKALLPYDFELLKIRPGFIKLKGLNYGFIGGASGLVSQNVLAFVGNIETHPDFEKIYKFLNRNGIEIKNLDDGELEDIGTIIPLKEHYL